MSTVLPLLSLPPDTPRKVVLDTNVVMALWHFEDPALQCLRDWIARPQIRLQTNAACLGELQRVLAYRQFAIDAERQALLHAAYFARCEIQPDPDETTQTELAALPRCRDRDDQKFLALAIQAGASLLVSRDKLVLRLSRRKELRERLQILSPEQLQRSLLAEGAFPAQAPTP